MKFDLKKEVEFLADKIVLTNKHHRVILEALTLFAQRVREETIEECNKDYLKALKRSGSQKHWCNQLNYSFDLYDFLTRKTPKEEKKL